MQPALSVAIATHGDAGGEKVAQMHLPQLPSVEYVVSWQAHNHQPWPQELTSRRDMVLTRCELTGLGNNRRNAQVHSTGKVILVADNDLQYTPQQLQSVIETFETHPQVQVASFKFRGAGNKWYPEGECDLKQLPKGWSQSAIEIAYRNGIAGLEFDGRFGLGAKHLGGAEDDMFMLRARKMGLNCRFFHIEITIHPDLSSGQRTGPLPAKLLRSSGAYFTKEYPWSFPPRLILKAWRLQTQGRGSFFRSLFHLTWGAIYGLTLR